MNILHKLLSAEPTLWKKQFNLEKDVEIDSEAITKKLDKAIASFKAIELACAKRKGEAGVVLEVSFYLPSGASKSEVSNAVNEVVIPLTRPEYNASYKKVSAVMGKLDLSNKSILEAIQSFIKGDANE